MARTEWPLCQIGSLNGDRCRSGPLGARARGVGDVAGLVLCRKCLHHIRKIIAAESGMGSRPIQIQPDKSIRLG